MPDDDPRSLDEETFDAVQAAAELATAMGREPEGTAARAEANPTDYTAILEDEVEALQQLMAEKDAAIEAAQAKAAEARDEVARARARLERDAEATVERKRREVIVGFLDVADDLGRAVQQLRSDGVTGPLAEGMHLVASKLEAVLARHDVRRRSALGMPFDPAHHEAIGTVPAGEKTPADTVAAVLEDGYTIGDETLRVARVVVAKG